MEECVSPAPRVGAAIEIVRNVKQASIHQDTSGRGRPNRGAQRSAELPNAVSGSAPFAESIPESRSAYRSLPLTLALQLRCSLLSRSLYW